MVSSSCQEEEEAGDSKESQAGQTAQQEELPVERMRVNGAGDREENGGEELTVPQITSPAQRGQRRRYPRRGLLANTASACLFVRLSLRIRYGLLFLQTIDSCACVCVPTWAFVHLKRSARSRFLKVNPERQHPLGGEHIRARPPRPRERSDRG